MIVILVVSLVSGVVLSYGPTSTSDGSVVITFTLRGYDNNSMKAAIEELEAQVIRHIVITT